jgi:hypothetical protein
MDRHEKDTDEEKAKLAEKLNDDFFYDVPVPLLVNELDEFYTDDKNLSVPLFRAIPKVEGKAWWKDEDDNGPTLLDNSKS